MNLFSCKNVDEYANFSLNFHLIRKADDNETIEKVDEGFTIISLPMIKFKHLSTFSNITFAMNCHDRAMSEGKSKTLARGLQVHLETLTKTPRSIKITFVRRRCGV